MDLRCTEALKKIATLIYILEGRIGQGDFHEWSEKEIAELRKLIESIKNRCPELADLVESLRLLLLRLQSIQP